MDEKMATVAPGTVTRRDEEREREHRLGELNKHEDPNELTDFVTGVVEDVRHERYGREHREAKGRR